METFAGEHGILERSPDPLSASKLRHRNLDLEFAWISEEELRGAI